MKPLLKWAGAKGWLAPAIRRAWESLGRPRLIEPFMGGLSVALDLEPKRFTGCDNNLHLVNLYAQVQAGLAWDIDLTNTPGHYDMNRHWFNQLCSANGAYIEDDHIAAQLFWYLNRYGFNGLCRFNSRGQFNVPYGRKATVDPPDLTPYRALFTGQWTFMHGDFSCVELTRCDLIYADPPYWGTFAKYTAGGFGWTDHERLVRWLAHHDGPVIASNSAEDKICQLYDSWGFTTRYVAAPQKMHRSRGRTDEIRELIAYRNVDLVIQ